MRLATDVLHVAEISAVQDAIFRAFAVQLEQSGPAGSSQHVVQRDGGHSVATHEHADHLSGFVQKGSPFLEGKIEIDQLWVGWTEKVGDGQADQLREKHGIAREMGVAEGLDLLAKAQDENLVQFGENIQKRVNFICNCCGCCCEAMIAQRRFGVLNPIHTSNFVPVIHEERS